MAHNALFVGWNRAESGRESHAVEHFAEWSAWLGKLQADGKIDSFDIVMLDVHGGDMNGFAVIKGDNAKLNALRNEDEWMDHLARGDRNMAGLGVINAIHGSEIAPQMARIQKYI